MCLNHHGNYKTPHSLDVSHERQSYSAKLKPCGLVKKFHGNFQPPRILFAKENFSQFMHGNRKAHKTFEKSLLKALQPTHRFVLQMWKQTTQVANFKLSLLRK